MEKSQPSTVQNSSEPLDTDGLALERDRIERARQGDRGALAEIVTEHQTNVYNLGLKLTGDEHEAECVLQDTFLKVFEKIGEFRGDSRLGTWIHRIATNIALMRLRSKKGKFFVPISEEPEENEKQTDIGHIAESPALSPLETTLNDELRNRMEKAIVNLPPHLRTAFVLKDLEGFSLAEISEEVEKSVSAVKADLHRARVRLRRELADFMEDGSHA
ncbi:sigma-70 family RNA polymerase sigma factor [bacterium]|nr:sigma-70 family RNA polymerase sigma factor [bacterium]